MGNEEIKLVEDDVAKYAKLESLGLSEGGKLLTDGLKSDIVNTVDELIAGYKTITHIEMIGLIAQLDAKFNIFKAIQRSPKNKKNAKEQLELILTE